MEGTPPGQASDFRHGKRAFGQGETISNLTQRAARIRQGLGIGILIYIVRRFRFDLPIQIRIGEGLIPKNGNLIYEIARTWQPQPAWLQ